VIEGRNPVLEALRAGRPVNKVLIAHGAGQSMPILEIVHRAREAKVVVERVDRRVIERLSPGGRSQNVLAIAAAKEYADLRALLRQIERRGEAPLLMVLDGIEDPQNLGAIIRSADAAGMHGVVIPARRAVGLTAAVARASAGAVEYVPVARVGNLAQSLDRLAEASIWTVGIDPAGSKDFTAVDYRQPTAIVIGAEGRGLSRLVKERCDTLASIPMKGSLGSLNASVAAALVMFEAMRQRDREQG